MPADARREPPPDAGHGPGRPPDGQLEEGSWAIARGLKSIFGWQPNTAAQALPPLTSSGLRARHEHGHFHAGAVQRPSEPEPDLARSNVWPSADPSCPRTRPRTRAAPSPPLKPFSDTWASLSRASHPLVRDACADKTKHQRTTSRESDGAMPLPGGVASKCLYFLLGQLDDRCIPL